MKDKEKEIQSIIKEYNLMRRKNQEKIDDIDEKSVINPELTLIQMRNLSEKDLKIQVMIALIAEQEEIQTDENKINTKIKNITSSIGNFRYTYDDKGNTVNADEMQKMAQKYEREKKELLAIKKIKTLCKTHLSELEEETGLTTSNVKEIVEKEKEKKRQYEKEKLRRERAESERIEKEKQQNNNAHRDIKNTSNDTQLATKINSKSDIITIFPNKNIASYIFQGKEGQISDIRTLVWGEKPKIFGKYKIKEEEYVLTNNKTGETKDYVSKLNPVVFEVFKTNSKKLEQYMQLESDTPILYVFEEGQKENKDVAKMMQIYQKQDKAVSQKIGYVNFSDRLSSRFSYKLGKKQLALPEATKVDENATNQFFTTELIQDTETLENAEVQTISENNNTTKEIAMHFEDIQEDNKSRKITKKEMKAQMKAAKKAKKLEMKQTKEEKNTQKEEAIDYDVTRRKMEEFRKGIVDKAKQYDKAIGKIEKMQQLNTSKSKTTDTD